MIACGADFLGVRHARTTETNLALAYPELPLGARRALARRSLVADARLALELPSTLRARPLTLLQRVAGAEAAEQLARAQRSGRGVLLLVPHLGNWELLCLWLQARADAARPFTALFRPLRDPELDRWLRARRERSGARLVPTDPAGLRTLLRVLRSGGMVGVLPDQVPAPGSGIHAPFHGRDALTMTLVRGLVRRCAPEVLAITALRRAHGYRIHLLPADPAVGDDDPRSAATALNRTLEACIALAPEQYQWGYKRYRWPPGSGDDYYVVRRPAGS
jgi:KDO2-lipid IV(A) lauroyltransferase